MKAKMKSADSVYLAAGLPAKGEYTACARLNQLALDLATSVASQAALDR